MHGRKRTDNKDSRTTVAGGTHTKGVFRVPPWSTASLGQRAAVTPSPRQEEGRRVEGDQTDRLWPDNRIREAGGPGRQALNALIKFQSVLFPYEFSARSTRARHSTRQCEI
jgi:hypothetical protein